LKGLLELPSLKHIYSKKGLEKYITELKLGYKSELKGGYMVWIAQPV
jgi:hypothetical protein